MAHRAEEKSTSVTALTPVNAHQSTMVNHYEHATSAANSSVTPATDLIQHTEASANSPVAVTNPPAPVDLTTCESVSYEMRDRVPGVKYVKDGAEAWTPVVKRSHRSKRKNYDLDPDTCNSSQSDTSESELDVSCSRMVQYSVREGVPGVSIHRRNVIWKPIVPSPVAARTRSRTKNPYVRLLDSVKQ